MLEFKTLLKALKIPPICLFFAQKINLKFKFFYRKSALDFPILSSHFDFQILCM